MKLKCLQCENDFIYTALKADASIFVYCPFCGSSYIRKWNFSLDQFENLEIIDNQTGYEIVEPEKEEDPN